jgi:catechol 2,3-dioxygenase-like lactoylglutathione lyase family enzyme
LNVSTAKSHLIDMALEVVVIAVADVDRANRFYGGLGCRLDADIARARIFAWFNSHHPVRRARFISAEV